MLDFDLNDEGGGSRFSNLTWEEAAPHLLPRIRSLGYLMAASHRFQRHSGRESAYVYARVTDRVGVGVVIELRSSMCYVQLRHAEAWGRSPDEVLGRSLRNLAALGPPKRVGRRHAGMVWLTWDIDFNAERLLLRHTFSDHELDGDQILLLKQSAALLCVDARDPRAMILALAMASDSKQMFDRALIRRADGRIEDYAGDPPHDQPPGSMYHLLARRTLRSDYDEQRRQLEDDPEGLLQVDWIAEIRNVSFREVAFYHRDLRCAVPEAELVCLVRDRGETVDAVIPWKTFLAAAAKAGAGWTKLKPRMALLRKPLPDRVYRALVGRDIRG